MLIGAWLAYHGTQQTLQANQEQSRLSQQASHDLLISQQVARGFEQLGSDKMVLRLGGIYALGGVMDGSKQYYQPVLEVLCAFVRDSTETYRDGQKHPPLSDIQAALRVIGSAKPYLSGARNIDLTSVRIPKANLNMAYLSGANLIGADLSGAQLVMADLSGAKLIGADLRGAQLMLANLSSADLTGADLSGAELEMANLSYASLIAANLSDARLNSGNLRFTKLFGADLSRATLSDANLSSANLTSATWLLTPEERASTMRLLADIMRTRVMHSGTIVTQSQLDQACGTTAELPAGLTLKPCTPPDRITALALSYREAAGMTVSLSDQIKPTQPQRRRDGSR